MDGQGRKSAKSEMLPGLWQESRVHSTDRQASELWSTIPTERGKVEPPARLF